MTIWQHRFASRCWRASYHYSDVMCELIYRPLADVVLTFTWWRHQMETFSALLPICAGNSPVTGEFRVQRPVTRSFDVFFDLRLNGWLSKKSWGWWFETPSRPLRHHSNEKCYIKIHVMDKLMNTSCEIALRGMPQNTFDDKSTLVQLTTRCRQAPSHYTV